MANLRILYDNAADRAAVSATNQAGSLGPANLKTDLKGEVHRSVGTNVGFSLLWPAGEGVSAVVIPACNLSATALIRVRLYRDLYRTQLLHDTGDQFACPGATLGQWRWRVPLNANSFIYGGYSKTAVYLDDVYFAAVCDIDLNDPDNPAGYIDCARLVVGVDWSPEVNAGYGVQAQVVDTSVQFRNDAGDLLADRGAQHETLSVPLPYLSEPDRAELLQIFRFVGTAQNFFLSLFPGTGMSRLEQDHMLYGKRANSSISHDFFNATSTKIDMEGW